MSSPSATPIRTARFATTLRSQAMSSTSAPGASALGQSNLYVTILTGSRVTQMTFSAKPYEHAGLSSDRRYIAANRLANGISSLWIIDLKNRTEAQLVPEHRDSGGGGMDWSP